MFEPFQNLIPKTVNSYGISKEAKAAVICHYFRSIIPKLFQNKKNIFCKKGEDISFLQIKKYISPAYFKNNILVVNVENSSWAQEVIIRKSKIIDEINEKAGEKVIQDLKTQLKNQSSEF